MSKLLNLKEVEKLTTLSRSTLNRLRNDGEFPPPLKLSKFSLRWREADILDWLESRITGERTPQAVAG